MFVVDTNLLLYAVNPDSTDHAAARALLEEWRQGERSWFLTWGIVYEFLRVSTHPRVFPQPLDLPTARRWLELAISVPQAGILVETDRHADVLRETAELHPRLAGNMVHDFHTAVLMKEHGVEEIRTADVDFHQFQFIRVVNPLGSAP
ncbi:MAG TPA: TA system VapC family ribonuclease toxin [Gemmatimonadaceae bacterium]|nr:TA system VapC family ribonuclease toxin [Gemmatimonadaceae bacterium]